MGVPVTNHLEKDIEAAVGKALNYWSRTNHIKLSYLKLTIPGNRGYPDRLILAEGGKIIFLELKRAGELPRKLQVYTHDWLRSLGFPVLVCDNVEEAVREITCLIGS